MLTGSDFTAELHLTAGLGALVLGGGALARGPRRALNRLFALLCAALGLWNLGYGLYRTGIAPEAPWRLIFLLGSCAAAPIGLHFCLVLSGRAGAARRWIGVAYAAAAALYLSA